MNHADREDYVGGRTLLMNYWISWLQSPMVTTCNWSSVLKFSEIPWLDGHQMQGQTVFPAASYVVMALEASGSLAADKSVELLEIQHLYIPRVINFEEGDNSGVGILVTLTGMRYQKKPPRLVSPTTPYPSLAPDQIRRWS